MIVPRVLVLTIATVASLYAPVLASCAIADPSPYNDISYIYFVKEGWTPDPKDGAPPSLKAGNVIVHAGLANAHLGGNGPYLAETIYTTSDPPIVVLNRLVMVLRLHHFYEMSPPSQSTDPMHALSYEIRVERCGVTKSLGAVIGPSDGQSTADVAFFSLLDDLIRATFESDWKPLYGL